MKKCPSILVLSLVLAITWGGEGFAQTKKEMTFSGTHYCSSTPKVFQVDPDRSTRQLELFGVRVNDSSNGPFHGASVHIVGVAYSSKGDNGFQTLNGSFPTAYSGLEGSSRSTNYGKVLFLATSVWSAIWPFHREDRKADQKAAKEKAVREEGQRATNTVNEYGPKLKPIWEAVLQAGQERVQALRKMGLSDTQMKIMFNIDPQTGFNGKELLFLAAGSVRGGWGRTWEGGGEGRYPANDNYDANMVTLLLSGKITSENLQKFIHIFDVNSKRYVDPQGYAKNKEQYDAEIQKGNAFLDQFANTGYAPHGQDEDTEKKYGFGVLLGEDVYQPYIYYFNKQQLGLLEPLFEQQWAAKEEAYYASRYAQQRQQKEYFRTSGGR